MSEDAQVSPRDDPAIQPSFNNGAANSLVDRDWKAELKEATSQGTSKWHGILLVVSATLTLLLAIIAGIYAEDISKETRKFAIPLLQNVSTGDAVEVFWILVLVTVIVYVLRAIEQRHATEQLNVKAYSLIEPAYDALAQTLDAALHFASPAVFATHPRHLANLDESIRAAMESGDAPSINGAIQKGLADIAMMASRFARAPDYVSYGANIMLVAVPPYPNALVDKLVFLERKKSTQQAYYEYAAAHCGSILYLPADLMLNNLPDHPKRSIPDIALPVPKVDDDIGPIPGAPWALLNGNLSVFHDTKKLGGFCKTFAQPVRNQINEYFTTGLGKDVGSFASIRIGTSIAPVGVLNVDCNSTDVLGRYDEATAIATFLALLTPFTLLLRDAVSHYAKLTWHERFPAAT